MLWGLFKIRLGKKERKMKNEHKRGRSARRGNAMSPYCKYEKTPYKYNRKSWPDRWPHLASTLWDKHKGFIDIPANKKNKYKEKREREYA